MYFYLIYSLRIEIIISGEKFIIHKLKKNYELCHILHIKNAHARTVCFINGLMDIPMLLFCQVHH